MAEQTLAQYFSRRNSAALVQTAEGQFVVKTFGEESAFQKERAIYSLLQNTQLPCARVIRAEEKTLTLTRLPGQNLVDCLQQQEQTGFPQWDVWEKLVAWLAAFQKHTGFVMTDVNLRNFLYDERTKILYGLDFEECERGGMLIPAAAVAAYIRVYKPENTPIKQKISQYVLKRFADSCALEPEALAQESERQEAKLLERRKNRK